MNLIEKAKTDGIICESKEMRDVIRLAGMVASKKTTVLITGETGVGKNIIAKFIHDLSPRKAGTFKAVNCSSLAETLLESELFGHVKGAFSDATKDHVGLFKQADGGTLFLDEVGDMSPGLQARVLHTLEMGEFRPVGAEREETTNVRVIAATNVDLAKAVREKEFRMDLYYRINVFPIHIASLRERTDDIDGLDGLVEKFIKDFNKEEREISGATSDRITGVTKEAGKFLRYASWTGNVRELRSAIEYAFIHHAKEGELQLTNFPESLLKLADASSVVPSEADANTAETFLERMGVRKDDIKARVKYKTPEDLNKVVATVALLIINKEMAASGSSLDKSMGHAARGSIENFGKLCWDLFLKDRDDKPTPTTFIKECRELWERHKKRENKEKEQKGVEDATAAEDDNEPPNTN
jgi:transcriptional regulator with GAF, ATPase, and Fis domain